MILHLMPGDEVGFMPDHHDGTEHELVFGTVLQCWSGPPMPAAIIQVPNPLAPDDNVEIVMPADQLVIQVDGTAVPVISPGHNDAIAALENRFTYHAPTERDVAVHQIVRNAGGSLARVFIESCPPSDELTHALDAVDQAVMWANAAIARNS